MLELASHATRSGGSFGGKPGFFRIPVDPPPAGASYAKAQTAAPVGRVEPAMKPSREIEVLVGFAREFIKSNGPKGSSFTYAQRLTTSLQIELCWFVPVRGYFRWRFDELQAKHGHHGLRCVVEALAEELRASFELAGAGPVDGAGELL